MLILLTKYFSLPCIFFFIRSITFYAVITCPSDVTMYPTYGACCHISLQIFEGNKEKLDTVFMKQSDIFVPDKCEITVDKNIL